MAASNETAFGIFLLVVPWPLISAAPAARSMQTSGPFGQGRAPIPEAGKAFVIPNEGFAQKRLSQNRRAKRFGGLLSTCAVKFRAGIAICGRF